MVRFRDLVGSAYVPVSKNVAVKCAGWNIFEKKLSVQSLLSVQSGIFSKFKKAFSSY